MHVLDLQGQLYEKSLHTGTIKNDGTFAVLNRGASGSMPVKRPQLTPRPLPPVPAPYRFSQPVPYRLCALKTSLGITKERKTGTKSEGPPLMIPELNEQMGKATDQSFTSPTVDEGRAWRLPATAHGQDHGQPASTELDDHGAHAQHP